MIRAAAAVLAVLVAGAGAWLALRDGADAPRGGVLGTSASSRPDVAPERVQIGATSQFDLAQSVALEVRAQGPGTLRAMLWLTAVDCYAGAAACLLRRESGYGDGVALQWWLDRSRKRSAPRPATFADPNAATSVAPPG